MRKIHTLGVAATALASVLLAYPVVASAQSAASEVQRDENQQQRIDNGLKDGQLSTGEASKLERGEAHIDRMEQNADRNGNLSPAEKARIQGAQNRESAEINKLDNNDRKGNPNSASSKRMQADVQRDVNQQRRIDQGVKSGSLNKRETGRLEGKEARVDHKEAAAGANGHVSAREQRRVQTAENHASHKIYRDKHNDRVQ